MGGMGEEMPESPRGLESTGGEMPPSEGIQEEEMGMGQGREEAPRMPWDTEEEEEQEEQTPRSES